VLKFQYIVNLGLATVLAVPAVTLGARQNESLETTLQRTLAALEELAGVEKRLEARDGNAIGEAVRLTETPAPALATVPGRDDAALDKLRDEVAGLQRQLDSLQAPASPNDDASVPAAPIFVDPRQPPTVGLDGEQLARLADSRRPIRVASSSTAGSKTAFEKHGYTADAAKLGRALYRESRFDEALASFEDCGSDPESRYWRARCLEKVGRIADALTAYQALAQDAAAAPWSQRAASDLEFVRWRATAAAAKDDGAPRK
jgi:tetratricopeptide (TPR) repeat protein